VSDEPSRCSDLAALREDVRERLGVIEARVGLPPKAGNMGDHQ